MADRKAGLSKSSFKPKLKNDLVAGLVNGVISVPDGLAAGALAGVSPVTGLYASVTGPIAGGLMQSSHMMSIATTSASAIAAGQAISAFAPEQREPALFVLVLLTGAMLALMALLKAGRLVRYVPYSVMQGFLFGVSLVLVLDQFAPMVGYSPEGSNEIVQFIDVFLNVGGWQWQTVIIGFLALALVLVLNGIKALANWSSLIALVVPSALMLLLGWTQMEQVVDVSPIPQQIPMPIVPDFSLINFDILLAAFSLAGVIAIQGAGVSQSVENLDNSRISPSVDLGAQGAANLVAGLFQGIPVGASVGQTALNISAGARTRWAAIFSGVWMLIFIVALAPVIELVPMSVLGALMVFAGAASIKPKNVISVFRTGWMSIAAFMVTLLVSLVASVPMAVVAGIALAIVLNMVRASGDVRVKQRAQNEDGNWVETDAPEQLASGRITLLNVTGDLFFAGAKALQDKLPRVADDAVVVLRIRGIKEVGATLIDVLNEYAEDLKERGGKLYLSGVHADVEKQLKRSVKLDLGEEVEIAPATDIVGESTQAALELGRNWLAVDREIPPVVDEDRDLAMPQVIVVPEGALQPPKDQEQRLRKAK